MTPLWQMFIGQHINPSMGTSDAALSSTVATIHRRRLLVSALNRGKIKPAQLSSEDAALAGIPRPHIRGGVNALSGVGNFFSNLLGERGLYGMATHIPEGIYQFGKSVVEDRLHEIGGQSQPGYHSQVLENIVKPTLHGFAEDASSIGELVTGHPKKFLEAPLNPLLDVGSLISGGATLAGRTGGILARSQAVRLGEGGVSSAGRLGQFGQRLAKITSTEGRTPTITGLPRSFSPSPTAKLAQIASDRFVMSGVGRRLNLPKLQERRALNRLIDVTHGVKTQVAAHDVGKFSKPVAEALNHMTSTEQVAATYSLMGVNTMELANSLRARLEESLRRANEEARTGTPVEGPHIGQFARDLVSPESAHVQLQDLSSPEVLALINHPTEAMHNFVEIWGHYVHGKHTALGIDPEAHLRHVSELQRELTNDTPATGKLWEHLTSEASGPYTPQGGITPNYVPFRPARDFRIQTPSRLNILGQPYFGRNRLDKTTAILNRLRPLEPLRNPIRPYLHESTLETVLSGAARTDPKLYLEHIRQVEEDILSRDFNASMIDRLSLKDPEGASQVFRSADEMNTALAAKMREAQAWGDPNWRQWDPRNWVLAHPEMPVKWYREGHNAASEVIASLGGVEGDTITPVLEKLLEERAQDFWKTSMGAVRTPGYAIPHQAFERLKANLNVNKPFNNRIGNLYASLLNRWRTLTLAYMPRWLVNTAVGSSFLTLVKGVINPRHYLQAAQLTKNDTLPARVRLGGVIHGESLEPGSNVGLARFPLTRVSFHTVQSVEDYFRSASFVQSLERAARQHMAETGQIIDHYRPFWNENRDTYIDGLIRNHPELVNKAIDDVDKFAYNFTSLSPNERRYVRLFIPFWGWYKFISKFAYRLPVEYPGRARIMSGISEIGKSVENELGPIPSWIRGSIILGRDKDGILRYIPTVGLNPMSQFLDPFAGEGKVAGILRLGQLNPIAQSVLSGMGVNPLDAGEVAIGPQEGVGADFLGRLTSAATGESTTAAAHGGFRRFLHSLLTSVPQVRIGELAATGGRPVYPESIPFVDERPMPSQPISHRDVSPLGILNQYFGAQPRKYDLGRYQRQLPKRAQYVKKRLKREARLIRRRE